MPGCFATTRWWSSRAVLTKAECVAAMDTSPGWDAVADVVRSGEFYRALGWDVGAPVDPHAEIRFEGLSVELDEHSSVAFWNSGSPDDDAAATVLSIRVSSRDEVDAVWTRMTGLGYESRQRPFDAFFGSRFAVLADPDGHQIGLLSPRSDAHRSDPPQPAPR